MKKIFVIFPAIILVFLMIITPLSAQTALFGMTSEGGKYGFGTIFEYIPATQTFVKKHDFDSINGATPIGDLIQASDGMLYGTTAYGGSSDSGVLFVYDPVVDTFAKKVDFNTAIGAIPPDGLAQFNDKLYGLTGYGGLYGNGVLFEYDPIKEKYTQAYNFDSTDAAPDGYLTPADSFLFGMETGLYQGNGLIFRFNPANYSFVTVHVFTGSIDMSAAGPQGSLLLAENRKMYATTTDGGAEENGVIFEFDPFTNTCNDLYDFDSNGYYPAGTLLQTPDGELYGTAQVGGTKGFGVLFKSDTILNTYNVLFNFDSTNGSTPTGALIKSSTDGLLYGMTIYGGSKNSGIIFSYNTKTDSLKKLVDLTTSTGTYPWGDLVEVTLATAGISKVSSTSMVIYPNPTNNKLIVNGFASQYPVVARIMDMEGRLLISQKAASSGEIIFDVRELKSGIYLVEVNDGCNNFNGKFIKTE